MKKSSLLFLAILSSLNLYAEEMPSFEGHYKSKSCNVMDVSSKVTPIDLATEIEKSDEFIISQTDDKITIDGNTDYWNMAPAIYWNSTQDNGAEIEMHGRHSTSHSLKVEYSVQDGYGMFKNKDRYEISLNKNEDGSVRMELKAKYKNLLTMGLWKKSTHIKCEFKL